ncbi:MAG: hypothetical protein HN413_08070 [Chloroflexi bacterium]|jgi:hypothetical protein|nr:hypothetical protein [Chloroflexota bacterium]
MTDYIPTKVNITYQRGDGGHSSRTIPFTHPFAAVDITEARLYIRNRVDGTLYVQIKLSTHPTQWDLGTDYTGDVTPAPDDTGALSEADYRYEIEVKTATATVTAQEGIWFSRGDIATDLALDDPPTNGYHVSADQLDAMDSANSPTGANPFATMNDVAGADAILDTVDPTVNDDANDGYLVGAHWVNTVSGDAFVCTDNSVGAAVWDQVNGAAGGTVDVVSNVAQDRLLGRISAGSGDSEELTATQARTLLNVEDGADVTDGTNVAAAGAAISGGAHHDGFSDFVADEHSPSASAGETTTGTAANRHITPGGLAGSDYGKRIIEIMHTQSDTAVSIGDGTIGIGITAELNGWNIVDCYAFVHTQGVTGTTDIQLRRRRSGSDVDVMSTKVTIGAEYYANDGVINTANDDLATGDQLYVDVDAVHSGTAPNGLTVAIVAQLP